MTTWQAIRKASAHQAGRPYFRLDNLLFSTSKLLKHVFSCSLLCKLCVFFYSRAAVSVVFHLAVLFRFYHLLVVLLCLIYFQLTNKNKDDVEQLSAHSSIPQTIGGFAKAKYNVLQYQRRYFVSYFVKYAHKP